jgi:Right handed beta helix region
MRNSSITLKAVACAIFILALSTLAQAQATRTWVSGVGNDVNPCSRTAPCKTFAGAFIKTASGGEISVLDPGGYGTLNITKPITIDGGTGAGWGSVLATNTQGFIINTPGANDTVHLRNLSINGAGAILGSNGIHYMAANTVHLENIRISRFSGDGIRMNNATVGRLFVRGVHISECGGDGIEITGTSPIHNAVQIDNSSVSRCGNGLRVNNRATVTISNSVLTLNSASGTSAAVLADSAVAAGAIIDVDNCQITYNSIGVQSAANQTVRLSNSHVTGNANALNFNGGTIASWVNNRIAGNAAGENFPALSDILQQ